MASASTRNSAWHTPAWQQPGANQHDASQDVAITPARCLQRAAELGAPARVVYDLEHRDHSEWLRGVEVLVLDSVRCLPQRTVRSLVAWAAEGGIVLASEDSGLCDGLGRAVPPRHTLASQLGAAGTWANISSGVAAAVIAARAWMALPSGGQRIVLPYAHEMHITVFVLCAAAGGCSSGTEVRLDVPLNASQVADSARLTAVDAAAPLAATATKHGVSIQIPEAPPDSFAVVLKLKTLDESAELRPRRVPCPNVQPYSADSPWNRGISSWPAVVSNHSQRYIAMLATENPLTSHVDEYDETLYSTTDMEHPEVSVLVRKSFSVVSDDNRQLRVTTDGTAVRVRLPVGAVGSFGSDGELIAWDAESGDELGFWQLRATPAGLHEYTATDGYRYNSQWSGVPPAGFHSRGAGVPYMVGMLRTWEVEQGHIDHALALSCGHASPEYVFPATKSDGRHLGGIPQGSLLQLDPTITVAEMQERWKLSRAGVVIAHCLQKHGAYVIDSAGGNHSKIVTEDNATAGWPSDLVVGHTVSSIPLTAFRVLEPPPAQRVGARWKSDGEEPSARRGDVRTPPWNYSATARSGEVCTDASLSHEPASENNTRWGLGALEP
jgi:hypothetical protein